MLFDKGEIHSIFAMIGLLVLLFVLALYFPASMQLQSEAPWAMLSTELEIIQNYHLPLSLQSPLNYLDTSNEPPAFVMVTSILSVMMGWSNDLMSIILLNYIFVKTVYLLIIPLFIYLIAKQLWGKKAIYSIFGAVSAPFFLMREMPINNYVFITLTFVLILFCIFSYIRRNNHIYMLILTFVCLFSIFTHQIVWMYEAVLMSFLVLFLSKDRSKAIAFISFIICALSISALFIIQTGYTTSVSGVGPVLRALLSLVGHIGPVLSIGILLAVWKRDLLPTNKHYSFVAILALTFLSFSLFSQSRIYAEVIVLCSIAFAPMVGVVLSYCSKCSRYTLLSFILVAILLLSYHFLVAGLSTHTTFVTYKDLTALKYLDRTNSERLLSNYDLDLIISGEKIVLPFISTELDKYPELANLKGFSRADFAGVTAAERFIDPKWTAYYYKALNPDIYIRYCESNRDRIVQFLKHYDLISRIIPWERIEIDKSGTYSSSVLNLIYDNKGSMHIYSMGLYAGRPESGSASVPKRATSANEETLRTKNSANKMFKKIFVDWPIEIWNSRGVVGFFPLLFNLVLLLLFSYKRTPINHRL
jgi:hypothetical protein